MARITRNERLMCERLHEHYTDNGAFTLSDVGMGEAYKSRNDRARFFEMVKKGLWKVHNPESVNVSRIHAPTTRFEPGQLCQLALNGATTVNALQSHGVPVPDLCAFFRITLPDDFWQRIYPCARIHRQSWE